MTNRVFKIVPASSLTYIGFGVVFLLMLIPFIALSIQCYKDWGNSTVDFWVGVSGLVLIAGVALLFGLFGYSARNSKIILSGNGLTIKNFIYGRTLSKEVFICDNLLKLDLRNQQSFVPVGRRNGIGLPGYQAGWFRLANKEKAMLVLTNKSNVVYLPTNKGYSVLLSVAEPEEFIKSIKEFWRT
jgi:hypothetical protein